MLKAGLVYFALVFGTGFVLGAMRVLWLVPRVGTRNAELIESPLMLAVTLLAAHWLCRRYGPERGRSALLGAGMFAVVLVLVADLGVGVGLRGMTVAEVFTERDPVSGGVYYGLLVLFALMPWWFGRRLPQAT